MVNNLIVFSDTHWGDQVGLCDGPLALDNSGTYIPSEVQLKVAEYWKEFWGEWVPRVTRNEPYAVVLNGDCIEGIHHKASHPISQNIEDQMRLALRMAKPIVEACEGRFYVVRGTPAHVGESSQYEEQFAERIGAIPGKNGRYARNELRIQVGNAHVRCLHHIGTTSSSHHEASAVNAEYTAELVQAARWGRGHPDFVVRSHRHNFIAVDFHTARGNGASIVTPGWQLKTPFAYKTAGARNNDPQFGGVLIRQGDEEFYYRRRVWSIDPPEEEIA